VVATGAVGSHQAGRFRLFRYEVRCWRGGSIPDLGEAVGGPRRLSSDRQVARRLLDLVTTVPTPVWGRDELNTGEMWNSSSMTAWLTAATGISTDLLQPTPGGRAPGWDAGLEVAHRSPARERGHPAGSRGFESLLRHGLLAGTSQRQRARFQRAHNSAHNRSVENATAAWARLSRTKNRTSPV
jgi:hypothetical protein